MKQLTLAGHPVHPMLIAAPLGLLPFSAVMDCMYLSTGKRSYADAAYYSLVGGVGGALVAAATGLPDYLTISPGGPMKQAANAHLALNLGLVAMQGTNLYVRQRRRSGTLPAVLNVLSTIGLIVSAWYGGELVYKHGMRVKPATSRPQPEARPPGDERIEHAFERMSSLMPAGGPGREQ